MSRWPKFLLLLLGSIGPTAQALDTPEGVGAQLNYWFDRDALSDYVIFKSYTDWKNELQEDHGLAIGFNSFLLAQKANQDGSEGDSLALDGIYRLQGTWDAWNRGEPTAGRLEFRFEYRSSHFGAPSAVELGRELGVAALEPGALYVDDFDLDLNILNWTQTFNDKRAGFAVGRLAFDIYQDAFLFQTVNRTFLNRAFVVNPAIATPGIGALGAVAKGMVSEHFWIGGQFYDANAENGDFDLDTVEEKEWLKSVEIGWTPEFANRRIDRVQLTYWDSDRREEADVDSGKGWALSASNQLSEDLIGFVRYGHSDGGANALARNAGSIGFEYSPWVSTDWSLGVGWAEPSDRDVDNEYVIETSWRVQITPQFSVMPDIQLLLDPANNPDDNSLWLVSLRAIVAL